MHLHALKKIWSESIEIANNNETRFTPTFKINSLRCLMTKEHNYLYVNGCRGYMTTCYIYKSQKAGYRLRNHEDILSEAVNVIYWLKITHVRSGRLHVNKVIATSMSET